LPESLDDSAVAELADVILVALGLSVVALVLYPPASGGLPTLLVLAEDLPGEADRQAHLLARTPPGSLDAAKIVLKTPAEFLAEPLDAHSEVEGQPRILTDRRGIALARLRPR